MGTRPSNMQILLTTRVAKKRGPTNADDWNDSFRELNNDLTNIFSQWNNRIVPLAASIPNGSDDVDIDAFSNGLDGVNLYVDADATSNTTRYFTSVKNRPRTIKEQFVNVYDEIDNSLSSLQDSVADLTRVASEVSITDAGNLYTATNVETALAEVMTAYNNVSTLATSFDGSLFAKLLGRAGGQTLIGGTNANDNLVLNSTSHATRGEVQINSNVTISNNVAISDDCTIVITSGSSGSSKISLGDSDDVDIGYIEYDNNDNSMTFGTNATGYMSLLSTGNLYIENSSDLYIRLTSSGTGTAGLLFPRSAGEGSVLSGVTYDHTNTTLNFLSESNTLMKMDESGNLRIGDSTAPTYKLDLNLTTNDFAIEDCDNVVSVGSQEKRLLVRVAGTQYAIPIYALS